MTILIMYNKDHNIDLIKLLVFTPQDKASNSNSCFTANESIKVHYIN